MERLLISTLHLIPVTAVLQSRNMKYVENLVRIGVVRNPYKFSSGYRKPKLPRGSSQKRRFLRKYDVRGEI